MVFGIYFYGMASCKVKIKSHYPFIRSTGMLLIPNEVLLSWDIVIQLGEWVSSPNKNIERHTAQTIVSWPNPKQWIIVHTSDLMMIYCLMLDYSECMHRPIQTYQLQTGAYGNCIFAEHMKAMALIHWAVRLLAAKSPEVSKPRDFAKSWGKMSVRLVNSP